MSAIRKLGKKCRVALVRFDRDEAGMEAVQIILILAVAAMSLLGTQKMCGMSSSGITGGGIFGGVGDLLGNLLGDGFGSIVGGFF